MISKILDQEKIAGKGQWLFRGMEQPFLLLYKLVVTIRSIGKHNLRKAQMSARWRKRPDNAFTGIKSVSACIKGIRLNPGNLAGLHWAILLVYRVLASASVSLSRTSTVRPVSMALTAAKTMPTLKMLSLAAVRGWLRFFTHCMNSSRT